MSSLRGPAYRIQTSRLVLRCWNPPDAPLLKQAIDANLEHLHPWMPWVAGEPEPLEKKIEKIRAWRAKFDLDQDYVYAIFNLEETRVLGGTGLHTRIGPQAREIGYWIDKDYLNRGLATEVAAALTRAAFEVDGVLRVEIHHDPANVRSAAVPRKLGYTCDATLRQRVPSSSGDLRDAVIWSLLASEYESSPASKASIQAFDAADRRLI